MIQRTLCYQRAVTIMITEEVAASHTDEQLLDELEDNGCTGPDSPISSVVENERFEISSADHQVD